jgi:hypothetical protein
MFGDITDLYGQRYGCETIGSRRVRLATEPVARGVTQDTDTDIKHLIRQQELGKSKE